MRRNKYLINCLDTGRLFGVVLDRENNRVTVGGSQALRKRMEGYIGGTLGLVIRESVKRAHSKVAYIMDMPTGDYMRLRAAVEAVNPQYIIHGGLQRLGRVMR